VVLGANEFSALLQLELKHQRGDVMSLLKASLLNYGVWQVLELSLIQSID
jgi:hypothetical protein